jgi:hypothetical protein
MFPLMAYSLAGIRSVWYPPSPFGPSVYMIEHCVIVMFNVFVYVSFFQQFPVASEEFWFSGKIAAITAGVS